MAKRWRKEEKTYLRRYAAKKSVAELATRFKVDAVEVTAQLEELELSSKDGQGYKEPYVDPTLTEYEAGLEAYYAKKWSVAAKKFSHVAEESDQPDIAARARLFLAACQERDAGSGEESEDPYLEAVAAKNRGDFGTALELSSRGGRRGKDERFAYLAASALALSGQIEEAVKVLLQAIEMEPENRIHAYHDPDFASLQGVPEFDALYES
jgi:tetratricopeptide (TPR) repeat protein